MVFTHERLRKARRSVNTVINDQTLFTYLNPLLSDYKNLPATNNVIEGMVNAQLRSLLRNHRGLPITHRAKACFWWCYMHSEYKLTKKDILKSLPTDDDIDEYYSLIDIHQRNNQIIPKWGDGIVWTEFHSQTPYPFYID